MSAALILPIGTQVVTLTEAKVSGEDLFHPRGAVGIIISQPVDPEHSYHIEFLDGSAAALKQHEFSIRKQHQNGVATPDAADLYRFIIYRCVVGSRAFGLDDENSDTDLRGIYLTPASMHWSLGGLPEQLENKDNEECYWELKKFLMLALKANPNILECLATTRVEYANDIARELLSLRRIFLSKLVYQTYNGYVMSQFKKIEQDLRTTGTIRWKHAMHLIRLLLQGVDILRSGDLSIDAGAHREKLLAIKRGETEWKAIDEWRRGLHREFDEAYKITALPERPDYEKANDFLIRARASMVEKKWMKM